MMTRLKKRYWIPAIILLIIVIVSLYGWRYWLAFKDEHNLSVDWQGLDISLDGLSFAELTICQQPQLSLKANNIKLSWSTLTAKSIDIYWQSTELTDKSTLPKVADNVNQQLEQSPFNSSLISTIIYWLPKTIKVDSLKFYQQKNELVNLKIEATKNQNTIELNLASNTQDMATLAANISFNQSNSCFVIENGILTTTLHHFGIEKGNLTLPFSGVLTDKQLTLKSSDKALLNIDKAKFSDDFLVQKLVGKVAFELVIPIPFQSKQINGNVALIINQFNGIYKASEIKSAVGDISILVKNNQLSISTSSLTVQEVNIGVSFEKVKLAGSYLASLDKPLNGIVKWQLAQATIFSGLVFLDKGQLNFAKLPQQFNLRLKKLQLKDIFAKYPAEGLAGDGAIDGTLPVTLLPSSKKGAALTEVIIKNGQLVTVNDGFLRFDNSALKNYALTNPNMKILTDLIKNFHYTKLSGTVNYANEIAKLGLNIQGSNRDVENNKAVNLNINLEENIAKLLISLQLADQINEPIRKRIEAYLKRKS